MKTIQFDKMQGAGNDYVYVDASKNRIENPEQLAIKISDRHFGIGSDGLVLIMPSDIADFRMRMFNADGSESAMCGNASRCVGKYVYEKGLTNKNEVLLETASGIKILKLIANAGKVEKISVDMDSPKWQNEQFLEKMNFSCISMGNPHAVTFVDNVARFEVEKIGRKVETNPFFPNRTNVEFAQVISPNRIKMRVWERGSGETLACGTGACATLVAAVLKGKAERKATLELLGGEVEVEWNKETNRITLTGGAEWVFNGEFRY